jgi:hypothetical protein
MPAAELFVDVCRVYRSLCAGAFQVVPSANATIFGLTRMLES